MIAALASWHEQHVAAAAALESVTALPAHALIEVYSVLTRLPSGLAVTASVAAAAIGKTVPDPPLQFEDRGRLIGLLARAGVFGGASYDGLVALEAAGNDRTLLTLDDRAQQTYCAWRCRSARWRPAATTYERLWRPGQPARTGVNASTSASTS